MSPPSRLGVYLGRRRGERSRAGDSGAAVAELIALVRTWGALIIVGVFAALFTHTDLTPITRLLSELSGPIAALGGAGGIAAAIVALRGRPSQANTEVASVDTLQLTQRLEKKLDAVLGQDSPT